MAVTCVMYSLDFAQWKWGSVARENDHGAGRIGLQLTRVEFITQSDMKDAGNHGINSILRMPVRHQLLAVGHFDPDCVRARLRGLTDDDSQPDGWWERRERFPIDIFGQDAFENVLPGLMSLDIALLSTRYGAGFLRHAILLRTENVKHHQGLSKHIRQDLLRTPPIFASAVDVGYGCVSSEDSIQRRMRQPPHFFSR